MTNELKPCPFCGCKDATCHGYKIFWVSCDYCGSDGAVRKTKDDAIAAWNRREGGQDNA